MATMELQKKIFAFRDFLDLPASDASASLNQIALGLIQDLNSVYPEIIPHKQLSEMSDSSIEQTLCKSLKSTGDSWMKNDDPLLKKFKHDLELAKTSGTLLDIVIKMAREKFETTDEQLNNCISKSDPFGKIQSEYSPTTPTSVLSDFCRSDCFMENKESVELRYMPPLLLTLRVEAVRKLNPNHFGLQLSDNTLKTENQTKQMSLKVTSEKVKSNKVLKAATSDEIASKNTQNQDQLAIENLEKVNLIFHPPQKSQPQGRESPETEVPAKSIPVLKGALAPPPPPPGVLRPKKVNTKLKRSAQLGSLYRKLRSKLEGTPLLDGKPSDDRRGDSGTDSNSGGKQGFADTLAEMTKNSPYFKKIEEDVQKYSSSIAEMEIAISSLRAKDMGELLKFQNSVESVLEQLTDEQKVLSKFENFPTKKLEALRAATGLFTKLDKIVNQLRNWKIESPIDQGLDKVERYFDKIKKDVGLIEQTKDEELKKFRKSNIDFDFNILVRVKEAMVDVSSSCMEMALRDIRESMSKGEKYNKEGSKKMLWRVFQLAYQVYTFAGGHDDRADNLTKELAQEIDSDSNHI